MHLLSGYISINATNESIRDLDTDSLPEKKKMLFSYPIIYVLLFVNGIYLQGKLSIEKESLYRVYEQSATKFWNWFY